MPYYDNWEDLVAAAQDRCAVILEKDVRPVIEEIVLRHIHDDIYSVYKPKIGRWVDGTTYERRYSLLSKKNLYHEMQDNGKTLMVTSIAKASPSVVKGYSFHNRRPGSFLSLLESGNMGIWAGGFPRPAISNAQREIDKSLSSVHSAIGAAIMAGLDKRLKS